MMNRARHWLRRHPRIYDMSVRVRRNLAIKSASYDALNEFSKAHKRSLRFVQVGASDGLHSDPIREFIVRDRWSGILVEPLPNSFARLQWNYRYLHREDLVFVNAAIVTADQLTGSFWTFSDAYLAGLSDEQRLDYVQKSSFNADHVAGCLHGNSTTEQAVVEISVHCLTLSQLLDRYCDSLDIDLLVTDCEGYEATLLPRIDWHLFSPTAVLFESHNLGGHEEDVNGILANNGYLVFRLGGDSLAVKASFAGAWQNKSAWARRSLGAPVAQTAARPLTPHNLPETAS